MGLNIKNERVHAMARQAAARAGLTQTGAIEAALSHYLADLDRAAEEHERRLHELLNLFDEQLSEADRAALRRDDLYDDSGLPR